MKSFNIFSIYLKLEKIINNSRLTPISIKVKIILIQVFTLKFLKVIKLPDSLLISTFNFEFI